MCNKKVLEAMLKRDDSIKKILWYGSGFIVYPTAITSCAYGSVVSNIIGSISEDHTLLYFNIPFFLIIFGSGYGLIRCGRGVWRNVVIFRQCKKLIYKN